jgi:pimeloyl-ACP methyl ester carboxylesterase
MTGAGLDFLAVDRVGTGRSDPVPAAAASLEADGAAVAAVIEWARGIYGCVVLYGEGLGAMIATCAAAQLAGGGAAQPDLLVVAGAAHSPAARLDPALLGPASRDVPGAGEGWAVARDPRRRHRLLHGPGADSAVLSADPGTMMSMRQFVEARAWMATAPGQGPCAQVTAPVLLIAGQRDPLVAMAAGGDAALEAAERPHYPRAAAFTAEVIPGAPHSLALDRSAPLTFGAIALTLLDVQARTLLGCRPAS